MFLDSFFRWLAGVQSRHPLALAAATVLLTLFMAAGIYSIRLETDFTKELPQDNPALVLNNRVGDTFSGQDTVFVLVKVDQESDSRRAVKDIRDPRVIQMLLDLEDEMNDKSGVDKTQSVGSLFAGRPLPKTVDEVMQRLEAVPGSGRFFNRDYSATIVSVFANVGSSADKVNALTSDIGDSIGEVPKPPGVRMTITGLPPIRVKIGEILVSDANYTISIASGIILLLLLVMTKPFTRGVLVFAPLMMALVWTLGTMGWLDVPLSMVTVGVGAMILGLGVEYSAFYVSVYEGSRDKGVDQETALYVALKEVGAAIFGSASTTVVGFLALFMASMPLMHHLGFTLALGITYCFITALVFNPALLVMEENYAERAFNYICSAARGRRKE